MTTTNELVTCWKCAGTGRFTFYCGRVEACYPCNGTGRAEARRMPAVRRSSTSFRDRLRAWYRNAQLPSSDPCHLEFDAVTDPNAIGWTRAGLDEALDSVPGSREAFRSIGWPV